MTSAKLPRGEEDIQLQMTSPKRLSPSKEKRRARRLTEAAGVATMASPRTETGRVVPVSQSQSGVPQHKAVAKSEPRPARPAPVSGLAGFDVRASAVRLIVAVTGQGRSLDDALAREFAATSEQGGASQMPPRDRGLVRLIAATVLRRKGQIDAVIGSYLEKPLPDDRGHLSAILQAAAAQLLFLGIAPHAVINIAVEQTRYDGAARRFAKLTNAVLRRVSEDGGEIVDSLPAGDALNFPDWMFARWVAAYGEETAGRIATASLREAALDLSVKVPGEVQAWAERLGARVLATGSIRVARHVSGTKPGVLEGANALKNPGPSSAEAGTIKPPSARVEDLPGFDEGAWWVQDAAAALPALLLGDVSGREIADLCAAPGGKTVQLAARGARVTAVDASETRLGRLRVNLARLGLQADIVCADATAWSPGRQFDAVLVDAPCTATGTIRRHPDIPHLKRPGDMGQLADLQSRLIDRAFELVRPGGTIVYCTCSLEPEEGVHQVARALQRLGALTRAPIGAHEIGGDASWITPEGDLRTLPFHLPNDDVSLAGMDGFYAARLVKAG
jgi:16S rRNA (cytosine967-C5)-methyltransferase